MRQPIMGGRITYEPGAEFLPLWTGVLMAILCILLIVTASRRPTDLSQKEIIPGGRALKSIVLMLVSLAAYIFLLDVLGYLAGTFFLNICLLHLVMQANWKSTLLVSLFASVSLYVIFQIALNVNLPKSMLGF